MQSQDERQPSFMEQITRMESEKVFFLCATVVLSVLFLCITFYNVVTPEPTEQHMQIMKCLNGSNDVRNSAICQDIVSRSGDFAEIAE